MKTLVEMLKSGKTGSRKRDSDSVYVVTENAIVIREFREYGGNSQDVLAIKSGEEIEGIKILSDSVLLLVPKTKEV